MPRESYCSGQRGLPGLRLPHGHLRGGGGGLGLPLFHGVPNRSNRFLAPRARRAPILPPAPLVFGGRGRNCLFYSSLPPPGCPSRPPAPSPQGSGGEPPSPNPGRAPRYLALGIAPRGPGLPPRRHGNYAGHAGKCSSAGGGGGRGWRPLPSGAVPRSPSAFRPGDGGAVLASALPAAAALFAGSVRGAGAPPVVGSSVAGGSFSARCPRCGGLSALGDRGCRAPEVSEGPRRFRRGARPPLGTRSRSWDPPLPLFFGC